MSDTEKNIAVSSGYMDSSSDVTENMTTFQRFAHSFTRQEVILPDVDMSKMSEYERNNFILAHQPLRKSLKARHLTMIAIGSSIGSGLFIGLGFALTSGPGALLIGFLVVGFAIYCVVQAAAELSVAYPVSGSFATHVSRFMEPALGFTVATNYCLSWLISYPSELIGASITVGYWSDLNPCIWIAIFWVFILVLNLFGVRMYGEFEFLMSSVKVIAVFIFVITGIVLIAGGGPQSQGYLGAKYWHEPGSFATPVFKSICNTFISAAFSFGGTELVVLTASESKDIQSVASASKQTFWRIALFYITTVVVIGCLVPYTNEDLLGSGNSVTASPFVIAMKGRGSLGTSMAHFMNAIVLIAVLSVANACVYAASRVIQALGAAGSLPSIFAYVDKEGRPLAGIIACFVIGRLGFLVGSSHEAEVFTWLFALCSICTFFIWFCICFSHIRFRMALKSQGRGTDELAYTAQLGVVGSCIGGLLAALLVVGEVYVSIWPLGEPASAKSFFQNCTSIPLMLVVYFAYRIYNKSWHTFLIPVKDIDLDSGRRYADLELLREEVRAEKARIASRPLYYRFYKFWC